MSLRGTGTKVEKPVDQDQTVDQTINQEEETVTETNETVVETKEVAVKQQASAPVVSSGTVPTIASLLNVWSPEEYGNIFPRIKGSNGALWNEKTSFGEYIDAQIMSHSDRWFVTPDSKPGDDEAAKFCRASYDGETIIDRETGDSMTIEEYKASVDEYDFKVSKYHDLYCIIFNADKNKEKALDLNIVQVSVSPTAVKGFTSFVMQTKLAVLRGQMLGSHQNCLRITAEGVSNKKGDYTILKFGPTPLVDLADYTPIIE